MSEAPRYYAVSTDAGAALEARALESGKGVVLTHIAVGDANLQEVTPDVTVTGLINEVCRRPIDARSVDAADPKITLLHATIPADVGGFWINELGIIGRLEGDEEEILYAYANHGRYYKMLPQDGQTITHELTFPIIQSTNAQIIINVADDGYATRQEYLLLSSLVESLRNPLRASWVLAEAVPEGGELVLPEGITYIPGHKAVMLSWEGINCHQGQHFEEAEAGEDGLAHSLKLLFTAPAGSEFEIFVHGHSDALSLHDAASTPTTGLTSRVAALEDKISTVSEAALYLGTMDTDNL